MAETRTAAVEPATAPDPTPTPAVRPVPVAPSPDVTIPDGDPAAAALALLAAVRPDAPGLLASRIDALGAELDDQVEAARLDPGRTLADFIRSVGRSVKLRSVLRTRAGMPAPAPASEVLALARSVRRWRPSIELKAERSRLLAKLRGELAETEAHIRADCAVFARGGGLAHDGDEHRKSGLVAQEDIFLRAIQKKLEARRSIRRRLAALDVHDDTWRAGRARRAIDAAGGVDALVEALAPSLASPEASGEELTRLRRSAADIAHQMERTDSETRRYADLLRRSAALEDRITSLETLAAEQRTGAARALVSAASGVGSVAAVEALESAVRAIRPELAEALASLRGDDAELEAVVSELIGPEPA